MRLNALLALSFMLALAAQVPAARAAQSACTAKPGYPAPNEPGQVFYLQRTSNANTVIYALNFDGTGKVDAQHPVDVYWRRYAEKGQRKELGFFERTFAFGARYAPLKGAPGRYRAHLVSYPALEVEVVELARSSLLDERGGVQVDRVIGRMPLGGLEVIAGVNGRDQRNGKEQAKDAALKPVERGRARPNE